MSTEVNLRVGQGAIKDQGRRGACVACAVTAAHELIRAEGLELSVEFLHWASKQCDALPAGIEGTTLSAAKNALSQGGQPPESAWPYDDGRDYRSAQYRPPQDAVTQARSRLLVGGREFVPTSTALHDTLDRGEPVVLGLTIFDTWGHVGQDGRIMPPPIGAQSLGGHAVLVVGYRDDDFIIQNSWGSHWGDGGLGVLQNDYVDAHGIAAWALPR